MSDSQPPRKPWNCLCGLCSPLGSRSGTADVTPSVKLHTLRHAVHHLPGQHTSSLVGSFQQLEECSATRNPRPTVPTSQTRPIAALPSSVVSKADSSKSSEYGDRSDSSATVFQELWDAALVQLRANKQEEESLKIVNIFIDKIADKAKGPDAHPDTQDLAGSIKDEIEQEINSRRHENGMARFMGNVVSALNKFASVGDVAVSFDPVHAALPWAAVRFVLVFLAYSVRQQQQRSRHFKAPFQLDTVSDHVASLEKVGQKLFQAGDSCERLCSSQDHAAMQQLLEITKTSQRTLEDTSWMTSNMYQENLLAKLPTAGAAFDHVDNQADATCHPETRVELLKQIDAWINEPNGHRTFWLQGLAGTGKSTISRTVAQKMSGNKLGASFFFKRGNSDRDNGRRFFTTIAYQLARCLPSLCEYICSAISQDPKVVDSLLEAQFHNLIGGPLRKLEEQNYQGTLVVVVDALDECEDESHTKAIINLLIKSDLTCLKVFLTSRPEYDIRKFFSYVAGRYQGLVLHHIDEYVIQHDIRVVLESRMAEFRHEHNLLHADQDSKLSDDWPGEQRLSGLVTMCTPLFITVTTLFRLLQLHNWSETPDGKIDFILRYSAASEYGKLYYPILCRMMLGVPSLAQTTAKDTFKRIVGSIVVLANPLSARSLARLLAVDKSVVESQLDPLHSVLDVPTSDAPIKLFHLSFWDFLVHEDAREFQIDEAHIHQELGIRCLDILSKCLKTNICDVESAGTAREDFSRDMIMSCFPDESNYASLYWVYHVRSSQSKIKDDGPVHIFLLNHFLHWLEALSLLDSMYETIGLLDDLIASTDVNNGLEVSNFLRDAKRFTMSFQAIISTSPLQVYASALVFSPMSSIVRQTFKSQFPSWLDRNHAPIIQSDWSYLRILEGHQAVINCIALSSRNWLISGSSDKTVKIWDIASGACIHTLTGHGDAVYHLAVSADGNLLVSGCTKDVYFWDTESGSLLKTWSLETVFTSMAFTDHGDQLFLVDRECSVWVCDTGTGKLLRNFKRLRNEGYDVLSAISRGGKWLAVVNGRDNIIKLALIVSDLETAPLHFLKFSAKFVVKKLVFSSDGGLLVSVSEDSRVEVWDTGLGQYLYTLESPEPLILSTDFAVCKGQIAMRTESGSMLILELKTRSFVRRTCIFERHQEMAKVEFVLLADHILLATCGAYSDTIYVWDPKPTSNDTMDLHSSHVHELAFTYGSRLLVSFSENEVMVWDASTGAHKQTFHLSIPYQTTAVSKKAPYLAASYRGQSGVEIWNLDLVSRVQTLPTKYAMIDALSLSDDGSKLVVSSSDEGAWDKSAVEIWDTDTGIQTSSSYEWTGRVPHVVISPDGKQVVVGKKAAIYAMSEIYDVSAGVSWVRVVDLAQLTFTPDGRHVLALESSKQSHWNHWSGFLCNAATGECVKSWRGGYNFHEDVHGLDQELLDCVIHSGSQLSGLAGRPNGYTDGYYIDEASVWLMRNGEKLLWLPEGYRPDYAVKSESAIAFSLEGGRVIIFRLK
ncbi:hypothetical protein F66182_5863 [Fusarium sp. NRRL 66182]|nr:hypothetical protein F66182_5863 [Fusarium sp. NRRL 66182]